MTTPRILVVDDEENIRSAIRKWLVMCGYQVDVAENGAVAVEKCSANAYDVITMDLEMPVMNGRDAIATIKEANPRLPIIVLTGYPHMGNDAVRKSCARVLTKPLRLHELEEQVRSLINV